MRHILFLAWRYAAFNRFKTALLVLAMTLAFALPCAAWVLVTHYQARLAERSQATPLLGGARGSRFDLVLHALYYRGRVPGTVGMDQVARIRATELAEPVPLHVRFTARGAPLVGTSLEYFPRRGLWLAEGTLPLRLGDCVLGAAVARRLALAPGGRLESDPENVFDLAGSYPLRMRVTGVLAEAGTPDDEAVFVDVKTAWVVEGLGHGHQDVVKAAPPDTVLKRENGNVVANAALPQFQEITAANIGSFHFHGEPARFPLTAILVWPHDEKAAALLRGRFLAAGEPVQMLVPAEVVAELGALVFRIKRFFDAQTALVALATALFLILIVMLSFRLRRAERETMFKLGCRRATVAALHAAELLIVLGLSAALSAGLAAVAWIFSDDLVWWLLQ